jgi:hypothetical protein
MTDRQWLSEDRDWRADDIGSPPVEFQYSRMAKRIGVLAAVALSFALAACTSPTAPAAPHDTRVNAPMSSAAGTLMGSDT